MRVTIKKVPLEEAKTAQSGHGGWVSSMEALLGKPGVVESVDKDGDVRVKMDEGSSYLWSPTLVALGGAAPAPAPAPAPVAAAPAGSVAVVGF